MKFTPLLISSAVIVLSACATTQTVEPEPAPVVEAQQPVFVQPPEPVVRENLDAVVDPALPAPGSVADFAYQTGEERVYFGYDQYDLSPQARDVLRRQAQWLNTYSNVTAIVAGNADERGTREYNIALGSRRADSVKTFLVSQGVNPSRLTTVSYGKERPIDPRSNEAGWQLNRNAHTNIISGAVG